MVLPSCVLDRLWPVQLWKQGVYVSSCSALLSVDMMLPSSSVFRVGHLVFLSLRCMAVVVFSNTGVHWPVLHQSVTSADNCEVLLLFFLNVVLFRFVYFNLKMCVFLLRSRSHTYLYIINSYFFMFIYLIRTMHVNEHQYKIQNVKNIIETLHP